MITGQPVSGLRENPDGLTGLTGFYHIVDSMLCENDFGLKQRISTLDE